MAHLRHKVIAIVLIDVLILTFLIVYFGLLRSHRDFKSKVIYLEHPINIAEFAFTDNQGQPFSKKNLQGHWSMVFFGFANCAMICPTTLAELNAMYGELQHDLPKTEWPQIVFVSVDPVRDSRAQLNKFVHSFNADFIGISADEAATIALEKELHVFVSNGNVINHSMEVLLFNPNAQVQAYFSYPHQAEKMAADYKSILSSALK